MTCESKRKTRILVVIPTWGTKNDQYLLRLVDEYRSMSFHVDIVVLSNVSRDIPGVEVVAMRPKYRWSFRGLFDALRRPWRLRHEYREWKRHMEFPFLHKRILVERMNDYDLFIYSEDDTLITERNIRAFLDVSDALLANEIPGFFRFEKGPEGSLNYPEVHGMFHWDPRSVRLRGEYALAFFTCEHAGCYALTREQLRRAIDSGGFLVKPHSEKYDLLCTAATDPYTQCGVQKLICISHLDDFLVHHLPNRYVGTSFGVDDQEFRRQVSVLLRNGRNGHSRGPIFETETKLNLGIYSKSYYEPAKPEVFSAIPDWVRTVLSVGCGWGATEADLVEKGLKVAAVPIDPVISGGAEASGVEIVTGDFADVRRKLSGRIFDCLLLSNVLHLCPNPVEVLSSFGDTLSLRGVAVAVVPNTNWPRLQGVEYNGTRRIRYDKGYENTGMHFASRETIRKWFSDAGLHVETFTNILDSRARRYWRPGIKLAEPWIAAEFLIVAKKYARTSDRPESFAR